MKNYPMICGLIGLFFWFSTGNRGLSEDRDKNSSHTETAPGLAVHDSTISEGLAADADEEDSSPVPEINPAAFVGLTGVMLLLFRKR